MHRLASRDPASTPWASNRAPNRATCRGSSWSPMASRAWSQVRQHLAGVRVEVGAGVLIPHRQALAVVLDVLRLMATRPGGRWRR